MPSTHEPRHAAATDSGHFGADGHHRRQPPITVPGCLVENSEIEGVGLDLIWVRGYRAAVMMWQI